MKLSFREKALIMAFVIAGLGYLFYTFIYSPVQNQRGTLIQENSNLQSQVQVVADKAKQNSGIVRDANEQKQLDRFQDQVIKVPGEIMLPESLLYIQKSAETSRVTLNSLVFTPGTTATGAKTGSNNLVSADEIKITLVAKGGYSGLRAFLLKIQKAPRIYRIDAVRMQSNYEQTEAKLPSASAPDSEDVEAEAVPLPEVRNEITMNVNMVTFYQAFKAPGFVDHQEKVEPGKGQDNPFMI